MQAKGPRSGVMKRVIPTCCCSIILSHTFSWSRQFLTLPASQFKHIWADAGRTAEIYNNHPLAIMNSKRRSMVPEDWARKMLEETTTNCLIQDPVPGKCVNGRKRSIHNCEYDFLLNGRRVEVKSSQLRWSPDGTWKVAFQGLKFGAFDDLYLVIFSPKWLDLIKLDLKTVISIPGQCRECSGGDINIRGETQLDKALDVILGKLHERGTCLHLGRSSIDDPSCKMLWDHHQDPTCQFYRKVPFEFMSPQLRGLRVERMVMEVDRLIHISSTFCEAEAEDTIGGRKRRKNMASYDWSRDGKRIEVKNARLTFEQTRCVWCCTFRWVKHACFDELLLVIYSPRGLDVFKHDGSYGVTANGVETETRGRRIFIQASTKDLDPLSALQRIKAKLESNGCPRIAQVLWDS